MSEKLSERFSRIAATNDQASFSELVDANSAAILAALRSQEARDAGPGDAAAMREAAAKAGIHLTLNLTTASGASVSTTLHCLGDMKEDAMIGLRDALIDALPLPPDRDIGAVLLDARRAAATISALRSAVATAKKALEPFKLEADDFDGFSGDGVSTFPNDTNLSDFRTSATVGDLRRARSALVALNAAEKGEAV